MANDILLDDSGKPREINGDFLVGESAKQEIKLILASCKGEWKENPMLGANIRELVKSRINVVKIKKAIRSQLEYDGFKKVKVNVNFPNVEVDGIRIEND